MTRMTREIYRYEFYDTLQTENQESAINEKHYYIFQAQLYLFLCLKYTHDIRKLDFSAYVCGCNNFSFSRRTASCLFFIQL